MAETVNENVNVNVDSEAVERQRQQQKKEYLGPREMAAYIISGFGDKNWETFNGGNALFFNTTFLSANPITLSLASTFCSIADTFDNAISGPILDRTRTRWGRVRPYFLFTLPLWFFSTVTPWILPDKLSQTVLFGIFLVIYYVGSIAGSFYNPAYAAILYNLTPNPDERNKLIATDTYVDLLGVWLPSIFPFFVDYLPRSIPTRTIYMGGAFVFIASVVVFRIYGFFRLKERVPLASREEMKSVSVFKSVKQVAACRPMWALLIKGFCGTGKGIGHAVENYFWLNCTGKLSNGSLVGLFTGLPSYFVLPFATKLTKKFGLRNLGIMCYLYAGLVYFIMFLVGFEPTGSHIANLVIIAIELNFAGALNSIQRYCSTALQGDMYDYVEYKTGIRNEGLMSAAMGYITLITNNASSLLSGFIIAAIKYKPLLNSAGVVIPQTSPRMLSAIWAVFSLAPAIGRTLEGLSLTMFNISGETRQKMLDALAVTRAAKLEIRVGTNEASVNEPENDESK